MPTLIRWPGTIKPGTVVNDVCAHEDMLTTLLAAAGEPNVKDELLKGKTIGDRTYKVHLDGYDLAPALKGDGEWPRKEFIYWTDDGNVAALRYDDWKITFLEQKAEGLRVWQEPFDVLRAPFLTNLRMDPFERARQEDAMGYQRWYIEHMYAIAPAAAYVGEVAAELQGVPAAPEARQLQSRPRHGGGDGASQLVAPDSPARFESSFTFRTAPGPAGCCFFHGRWPLPRKQMGQRSRSPRTAHDARFLPRRLHANP